MWTATQLDFPVCTRSKYWFEVAICSPHDPSDKAPLDRQADTQSAHDVEVNDLAISKQWRKRGHLGPIDCLL